MIDGDPKEHLGKIEDELRRLGLLDGPLETAQQVQSAFGGSEMPFEHWLVKVFLPRAHGATDTGQWPAGSQVGVAAIRNFDGQDAYERLVTLLCEFDQLAEARNHRVHA